ncbi:membrane protein insertase YidC [Eggerthellaceae bacterium zg-1084]|uniref:membrane protein insertase YidC n=1 Tax=Berryella wangjianweii TaxID=2734634 RepID=UPI001556548A|nr:membrane protein insertase YidC [Berryella wangjianweii]NPD30877.1 membrane protein insertase YidC [Berryella wangjianweii]
MFAAIASALDMIVQPCYALTGNWWLAILLFTIITKIILIPMSLWCQKNSIVMVALMPDLNRIKVRYFGDREAIGEKQSALFKEKHYHPMLSLVPLAVQVIILFGLVDVIHSITDHGAPGTEFLGLVPVVDGGLSWIMPVLAGLSAVVMGFAQNRINPLQKEQSRAEKNTTNGLSIGLSLVLGVFVAAGMAFYWIVSNLTSVAIQALMNIMIKPEKHIDYADLEASRVQIEELNKLDGNKAKWWKPNPLAKREKADYKRFFNVVNKHIVFYSEGSGFYKYFKGAIEYLLKNSDASIHYVTNDPNDQIFKIAQEQPRIRPYYIDQQRSITLMMKMDADVVVSTLEDLDNYYIKRSYVRHDNEYVFMFHHMTSTHLTATKNAYDHFDALLCVGPHQVNEVRRAEQLRQLPAKTLVECGYDLLDRNIAAYEDRAAAAGAGERPVVLIAPSWQESNLLDVCFDDLMAQLLNRGWRVVVRPHPEYTKRYRARWEALQNRYAHVPESDLYFERDFTSNATVFSSDLIITDWSSVFCEFSFSTLKPTVFIDTPMKVGNPDWQELGIQPTDISLRNEVGVSFDPEKLDGLGDAVADMIGNADAWKQRIAEVRAKTIFNIGGGAEAAGAYLLDRMIAIQEARAEKEAETRD